MISHGLWLDLIFIQRFVSSSLESDFHRRYMAEILPIRPKTLFNQSIIQYKRKEEHYIKIIYTVL